MNKTALITGGSRGIGLGIANKLAGEGINLAINGIRSDKQVADTIEKLKEFGVQVIYCQGDISIKENRLIILEKIKNEFGRLNFLINNAGVAPKERKDLLESSEDSFEYVLKTNLQGPYFLSQAVANWLVEQKQADVDFCGSIINISSISATVASVNRGEYCLSKAGLSMMTKLFSTRLGEYNIPVYEVRPGIIETDMTSAVKDKYDRMFAEGLAIQKRWGTAEDVGKSVVALIRGDFPYSTGTVIMVDGGLTINRL
jgi:NAD(P)-dependent dehydrogenase (short-subunit alcohol dehydrogenase family)